jgi:thioredoxin-related protein
MNKLLAVGLLLAGATTATAQEQASVWYADFDLAAAAAQEQGKDLLVDFTGSDWCGWCIKLDEQVFDHEAFLKPAQEKFILLKLDFPNGEEAIAAVPNPKRNEELQGKYKVGGFPTVLLMTATGEVFGQTGYEDMTPEEYVANLAKLSSEGKAAIKAVKELVAQYQTAEDKLSIVKLAIDQLGKNADKPGAEQLADLARKIFTLDPENKHMLAVSTLQALVDAGLTTKSDFALAQKYDAKNENGLIEGFLKGALSNLASLDDVAAFVAMAEDFYALGNIKDKEFVGAAFTNAAYFCNQHLDRLEDAKTWAKRAKEVGGLDEDMLKLLDSILTPDAS